MNLIVNGQRRDFDDKIATLELLLEHLQVPLNKTAVEINQQIIVAEEYSRQKLKDSDRIEIVSFVGGG